jgi:hypothetical protein
VASTIKQTTFLALEFTNIVPVTQLSYAARSAVTCNDCDRDFFILTRSKKVGLFMSENDDSRPPWAEWSAHYEKEQDATSARLNTVVDGLGSLEGIVSRLAANMETWIENQRSMGHRMNRPWQWGAVVGVFMGLFSMSAMFGVMATLIITPINDNIQHQAATHTQDITRVEVAYARDVERNLELHMWFRETLADIQVSDAKTETNIEWLMKIQDLTNERLHKAITEHPRQ